MRYVQNNELRQQRFIENSARWARSRVRVGKHWRTDTWELVMEGLTDSGAGMREAGPIAVSYYATILQLAMEYLLAKPDPKRSGELYALFSVDYLSFQAYSRRLGDSLMNKTERKLFAYARVEFATASLQLQLLCSNTT